MRRSAAPPPRPFIYVLAGVNGAGKSSVGGAHIESNGLTWFNPDTYARALVKEQGRSLEQGNAEAWEFGRKRLATAIAEKKSFAFETTLGANTIPQLLQEASRTHDVLMWFCGLTSPEQHIARVKARVAKGGHPIPEKKIRERWDSSRLNVIHLLPYLARLQVYDNSVDAPQGQPIPDPMLVLEMTGGRLITPDPHDAGALAKTPAWAKQIVQAAIDEITRSGDSQPTKPTV